MAARCTVSASPMPNRMQAGIPLDDVGAHAGQPARVRRGAVRVTARLGHGAGLVSGRGPREYGWLYACAGCP